MEPSRLGPRPLAFYLGQAAAAPEPATAREHFLRGVRAYWAHPYRRRPTESRLLWRQGSAQLLDVGGEGPPVLVIPSLINRAEILDLLPGRSLLEYLAASGYRPLLLDWGVPRGRELRFTLSDHIHGRAAGALDTVLGMTDQKPILMGYCLGGLLATALAAARPDDLAGLAVLATPWAFGRGPPLPEPPALAASTLIATLGYAPVDLLQALFAQLDPLGVVRKYARFGELAPDDPRSRIFVAVEDWLNDGVPMAGPAAQECLLQWYGADLPGRGLWAPGGVPVCPERLELPAFVAVPHHDRIVPAASAAALAGLLPQATLVRPAAGHVSMVVGDRAEAELWRPLTDWLRRIAPGEHRTRVPAACAAAKQGRPSQRALRPVG